MSVSPQNLIQPVDGLSITKRMEEFSYAYVHAIASVVGCTVKIWRQDEESIDITLRKRGGRGKIKSPELDIQVKCTGQTRFLKTNYLSFPLKIKNYNDLRQTDTHNPQILVVIVVPSAIEQWLLHSEKSLAIHHCGYWVSLAGMPERETDDVSIRLPRNQQFSVESLEWMMGSLSENGAFL